MTVELHVSDDTLDVVVTSRFDRMACMTKGFSVPMADVVGAHLATFDEVMEGVGWRLGGGYVPGRVATGWYGVPDRKGARQFLAVFRDRAQVLVVDTDLDQPTRIVLSTDDRERLAWWINERVHPAAP